MLFYMGAASHYPAMVGAIALLGWVAGCAAIWSSLFAVGNYLYGRLTAALALTAVFVVSGLILMRIVSILWSSSKESRVD